ncbi:hypothetical protein Wenmar_04120 (plasmid) [Wenxinia marina DSM 24838]|uniref:Glycosyltransferase 2-like domain-containing protein n=2 Tax=Wenxinia TaxID=653686 RepID=A0A0D0NT86_9RHOB|nr:hypothetical protein Wenmar_04120 [Wenxinia marina DSM 24838]
MSAAEHYLLYGGPMGRDPGTRFSAELYLDAHPDIRAAGLNPLLHYATDPDRPETDLGAGIGRRPSASGKRRIMTLRRQLLNASRPGPILDALETIAAEAEEADMRGLALRELARWYYRQGDWAACRAVIDRVGPAGRDDMSVALRIRFGVIELLACHGAGDRVAGLAIYERLAAAGLAGVDTILARSNLETTAERRCHWISGVLQSHGLSGLKLRDDPDAATSYDRLDADTSGLATVADGPKVTVLVAAYDAAATLPTALRSLQAQTWRNLEILVLDDCSPDEGRMAEAARRIGRDDPRIRLIQMERNGGAYIARNRGLDEATGEFVTIHDADDWSHPQKIEIQMRHMLAHPETMGCTSEQARATEDLGFYWLRHTGGFVIFNTSSFLFRRAPMREHLGYWDTVRFGADSELIRRMQIRFGDEAVSRLETGPLSFQRESGGSATTDSVTGLGDTPYGARRAYKQAQEHHHARGASLRYGGDPAARPFAAPGVMRLAKPDWGEEAFDLIAIGDLSREDPETLALRDRIAALVGTGGRVALVEAFDEDEQDFAPLCAPLRDLVDGTRVVVAVFGERIRGGEILHHKVENPANRYLPEITAGEDISLRGTIV